MRCPNNFFWFSSHCDHHSCLSLLQQNFSTPLISFWRYWALNLLCPLRNVILFHVFVFLTDPFASMCPINFGSPNSTLPSFPQSFDLFLTDLVALCDGKVSMMRLFGRFQPNPACIWSLNSSSKCIFVPVICQSKLVNVWASISHWSAPFVLYVLWFDNRPLKSHCFWYFSLCFLQFSVSQMRFGDRAMSTGCWATHRTSNRLVQVELLS